MGDYTSLLLTRSRYSVRQIYTDSGQLRVGHLVQLDSGNRDVCIETHREQAMEC